MKKYNRNLIVLLRVVYQIFLLFLFVFFYCVFDFFVVIFSFDNIDVPFIVGYVFI